MGANTKPPNATLSGRSEQRELRSVEARSWAADETNGNAVESRDLDPALRRCFRECDHLVNRHDMSSGHRKNYETRAVNLSCAHGTVADQETPAACYTSSPRVMPDRVPPLEYPDRFEVRYVSANGGIRWNSRWVNVSIVCVGEYVGLEELADGLWNVYFGPLRLGRLHERRMRIEDEYGRLYRHRV
jgi:hypothetical protein